MNALNVKIRRGWGEGHCILVDPAYLKSQLTRTLIIRLQFDGQYPDVGVH